MTEQSKYLLALARRNMEVFTDLAPARAGMISGSVAEGVGDNYSDIDMMVYYDALPEEKTLEEGRRRIGGSDRLWQLGDRASGAIMESYRVLGVECQTVHVTVEAWERDMAVVLEQHLADTPLQKALSGTLTAIPVFGEELISKWKRLAANYPEPLRLAMVEHYMRFFPIWGMEERFFSRDALLWFNQTRVETLQNLFGVLAGLNRVYFTTFQFKRMADFTAKLKICPAHFGERAEQALQGSRHESIVEMERLVRETVDIVERELPQFDTSAVRRRIDFRPEPWRPDLIRS